MSDDFKEVRLPPPAFPPGHRRHASPKAPGSTTAAGADQARGGYISPDDPLPQRRDSLSVAFISPDDPMPERKIELLEEFQSPSSGIDPDDEGVVVGMDMDDHMEAQEVVSGGDPHVRELIDAVTKLSDALNRRGEAGLRTSPQMSRFEATLRSYCVGYLAGRRAEEPVPSVMEDPLPWDG